MIKKRVLLVLLASLLFILVPASLALAGGWIVVNINGPSTAQWSYDGGTTWLASGTPTSELTAGTYTITFEPVWGWIPPSTVTDVRVKNNKTITMTATYVQGGGGSIVPEDWPVWAQPSYQGAGYAPLSFTLINRNILTWVESDKTPSGSVWGSTMKMVDFAQDETIKLVEFPATQHYLYSTGSNVVMSALDSSVKTTMTDTRFVFPAYVQNWLTLEDPPETIANQQFSSTTVGAWVTSWISFLKTSTKAGLPLSDTGHGSPVATWHDNVWLKALPGYPEFSEGLKPDYDALGGAVIFLPTTDGVIHAFDADADNNGYFKEIWGAMPLSSFLFGAYQEMHKQTRDLSLHPRIPTLGAPILVHDVEDGQGGWIRLLIGTTGEGVGLAVKAGDAWDKETVRTVNDVSDVLGLPADVSGYAMGVFALDITDVAYNGVKQRWSVSNVNLGESSGFLDLVSSATGNSWIKTSFSAVDGGSLPAFAGYRTLRMSLSRPVVGYTGDTTRTWHAVLLGIDNESRFRLYDINPLTGELIGTTQLTQIASSGTEIELPSKIGAVAPWGEYTPKLEEIYFYLSNGSFHTWDLNAGTSPQALLNLEFSLGGEYYNAEVVQDFDGTFLMVDGEIHRFVAFVVRLEKAGVGQGGGVIYGALVVDVTKLKNGGSLPETLTIGTAWGQTNVFRTESSSVQSMYLAEQMHGNEAFPVSAPFFYDGKLIIAATGYQSTAGQDGFYGKIFVADPLTGEVQTQTYQDAQLVGGSLVDESGILRVVTSDGTVLSLDLTEFGLEAPGSGGGTSGDIVDVIYWKRSD